MSMSSSSFNRLRPLVACSSFTGGGVGADAETDADAEAVVVDLDIIDGAIEGTIDESLVTGFIFGDVDETILDGVLDGSIDQAAVDVSISNSPLRELNNFCVQHGSAVEYSFSSRTVKQTQTVLWTVSVAVPGFEFECKSTNGRRR